MRSSKSAVNRAAAWRRRSWYKPARSNNPAVGRTDVKGMNTSGNVGVDRGARGVGIEPYRVHTVETVLNVDVFRRCEIDGSKVQLHVIRPRTQHHFASRSPFRSSHSDLFHEDRGFAMPTRQRLEVQHGEALHRSDPELAVGCDRHVRLARAALPGV